MLDSFNGNTRLVFDFCFYPLTLSYWTGLQLTSLSQDVLKFVPQGVHQWKKFVEPRHLTQVLERCGCSVKAINGFTYNPFTNHWFWIPSTAVNYACVAVKN
ncbi:hypothetical protein ANCCAN_19011 [Ancylostoma caninum]|uniref:Uncharacterized protein n=1 Tax=Ancylostoma caninum TaxID=29170 RepID=A0A368FSI9_ANCCA|nr:hypothetical protein ANCCAN_19011 [Ancylostoma caninum]